MRIVLKYFVHVHDHCLFKASRAAHQCLTYIGFANHTPKLSLVSRFEPSKQRALTHALVSLKSKFTNKMVKLHNTGTLHLAPVKILLRPKAKWTQFLAIVDCLSGSLPPMPEVGHQPARTRETRVCSAKLCKNPWRLSARVPSLQSAQGT